MKIGILADIHERTEPLRAAIKTLRDHRVEQVVMLGDVFETGQRIRETIELLRDVNAIGVWGNHELGLSNPDPKIVARYDADIIEFFGSLKPHLELEDILFSHGIPTWDPMDPAGYYLNDPPWEPGSLEPMFATLRHRLFLTGHYHRWYVATPRRPMQWDGTRPIVFDPAERYFVVVNGILNGWCAILDTKTGEFTPRFVG
jgi:predicted phosphodiesterase